MDCSQAVALVNSTTGEGRLASHLMAADIVALNGGLIKCDFSFAPRKCNKVAHALAKLVLDWSGDSIFLSETSSCLASEIVADVLC